MRKHTTGYEKARTNSQKSQKFLELEEQTNQESGTPTTQVLAETIYQTGAFKGQSCPLHYL